MMSKAMECQSARELFSEHLDSRLVPESRSALENHLGGCGACRDEWDLYARVFRAVGNLSDVRQGQPFRRPAEAPGSLARARFSRRETAWSRVKIAASIVVLLAISHVAVFEFARGRKIGFGASEPSPSIGAAPLVASALPRSQPAESSLVKRRLKDHVDAAQVLTRQVAYMPEGAEDDTRRIVRAQLAALDPSDLIREVGEHRENLGVTGAEGARYLYSWKNFSRGLDEELSQRSARLAARLRTRLLRSPVLGQFQPVRLRLAAERQDAVPGVNLFLADAKEEPNSVQLFLSANNQLLSSNYLGAVDAYDQFATSHPSSRLVPLSRYMQADSYQRVGLHNRAMWVASQLHLRIPSRRFLSIDPVGAMCVMLRRQPGVPLPTFTFSARQQGAAQPMLLYVDAHGGAASFDIRAVSSDKPRIVLRRER